MSLYLNILFATVTQNNTQTLQQLSPKKGEHYSTPVRLITASDHIGLHRTVAILSEIPVERRTCCCCCWCYDNDAEDKRPAAATATATTIK